MDHAAHIAAVELEADRMLGAATDAPDLGVTVPTCPDWTLGALLTHVAQTYLHKVAVMRTGAEPADWPPDFAGEDTAALLARARHDLVAELAARPPGETCHTWYDPDRTVGFWARRMALESAVHRVDAELAAGLPVSPVEAELAIEGIEEVLTVMLAWGSVTFEEFRDADLPTVAVRSGGREWYVRPTTRGVVIDRSGTAATIVTAEPSAMLLWLWRRAGDDVLTVSGDPAQVPVLRGLMADATG